MSDQVQYLCVDSIEDLPKKPPSQWRKTHGKHGYIRRYTRYSVQFVPRNKKRQVVLDDWLEYVIKEDFSFITDLVRPLQNQSG